MQNTASVMELAVDPAQPQIQQVHKHSWTIFRLVMILLIVGLGVFAGSILRYGYTYYMTPVVERYHSPLHSELKPGGTIGRMLGMAGSGMLLGLLLYSLRKRVRFMKNWGKLSHWLQFHIFLGIAGPVLITFHSALKLRGIVAISYWSMMIVMVSGMIGKYLYAQINSAISDTELEYGTIRKQIDEINARLSAMLDPVRMKQVQAIADFQSEKALSSLRAAWLMVSDDVRWLTRRSRLHRILNSVKGLSKEERADLYHLARHRELLTRRITLLRNSQQMFRYWHILHLPLAQTMYIVMVIHIVIAVMTGYL